jgi:hypothetical protein
MGSGNPVARWYPCHGDGVENRVKYGLRSEVFSERPEGKDARRERPATWHGCPRAAQQRRRWGTAGLNRIAASGVHVTPV